MRVLCVKYSVPGLACYRGYVAYEDIIVVTGTGDVALTCPRQNNNDVLSPIKHGYHCTGPLTVLLCDQAQNCATGEIIISLSAR